MPQMASDIESYGPSLVCEAGGPMSEYYCSHKPPCCLQLDALRSRVAEMEKALTLVCEFIAEVRAYGVPLKPSEMNVIEKTIKQALKEDAK